MNMINLYNYVCSRTKQKIGFGMANSKTNIRQLYIAQFKRLDHSKSIPLRFVLIIYFIFIFLTCELLFVCYEVFAL